MSRRFVLVTATQVEATGYVKEGAGIRKLKRSLSLLDFVHEYLAHFDSYGAAETTILKRGEAYTVTRREPSLMLPSGKRILTWTFTEYPEDELLVAVAHLSRDELLRDLKDILPLKVA